MDHHFDFREGYHGGFPTRGEHPAEHPVTPCRAARFVARSVGLGSLAGLLLMLQRNERLLAETVAGKCESAVILHEQPYGRPDRRRIM